MNKRAFTMIELVFVIVILGILAATALVKLNAVQKSALSQNIESFVGTMNRTSLPSMYSKATRSGGSVLSMKVSTYIKVPDDITLVSDTLTGAMCPNGSFGKFGETNLGLIIYCRDGNITHPPVLSFSALDINTTLADSYYQ
ncbi:MAG: type II secretion system protein [Campylobacterota bacterium]|nr:type II secretion system protein [Campylobacterota bacterium]